MDAARPRRTEVPGPTATSRGRRPRGRPGHLEWEGSWNARDLGLLPAAGGQRLRPGALVRSEHLVHLTADGWSALRAHGVRTVVDLRTTAEAVESPDRAPPDVVGVSVPLEDGLDADPEFAGWAASDLLGTPLYWGPFVRRWPVRCLDAVRAVAHARPGGVLVHCSRGCDRTGMVVALLLLVCGVDPALVARDYALTQERLATPSAQALGRSDDSAEVRAVLLARGLSGPGPALEHVLAETRLLDLLRAGGLTSADERALRARLLEPDPAAATSQD